MASAEPCPRTYGREFTSLRYFVLDGSDYPDHTAQQAAIAGYIRWGKRRAQPARHFAIGSTIRQPDWLPLPLDAALAMSVRIVSVT